MRVKISVTIEHDSACPTETYSFDYVASGVKIEYPPLVRQSPIDLYAPDPVFSLKVDVLPQSAP